MLKQATGLGWLRAAVCLMAAMILLATAGACARQRPIDADRRVVVLEFQTMTGADADPRLGETLASMLTAGLVNQQSVVVVDRADLRSYTGETWRDLARRADLDYVITGTISRLQNNYIVSARILSVATGEAVKGSSVERACEREEDLYPVMVNISDVLGHHLQVLAERHQAWAAQQPRGWWRFGS